MKKITAKLSLSKTTKIGLLVSYFYSVLLFINFFSQTRSFEHLVETNYFEVMFAEEALKMYSFIANLSYGQTANAAFLGILLIGIAFLITLLLDIKNQQISKKSFFLALGLFLLALLYPCFILWGHGFINYL